jgi:hypothetical protein
MKSQFFLVILLTLSSFVVTASNGNKKVAKKPIKAATLKEQGKFETRMAFNGTKLKGKLNEGSLRKIVVENDKSLEDLLGVRKKFDDREQDEMERNASW